MNKLTPKEEIILALLEEANNMFFTITFIKLDGNKRVINGRNVVKHIPTPEENTSYIRVFDTKLRNFCNIDSNTIVQVNINGTVYNFGAE